MLTRRHSGATRGFYEVQGRALSYVGQRHTGTLRHSKRGHVWVVRPQDLLDRMEPANAESAPRTRQSTGVPWSRGWWGPQSLRRSEAPLTPRGAA